MKFTYFPIKLFLLVTTPVLILILGYFALLFVLNGFDPNFLEMDRCMDGGGCWDSVNEVCRGKEINAQELCDRGR